MQKRKKFSTIVIITVLCLVSSGNARYNNIDIHSTHSLDGYLEWSFLSEEDYFSHLSPCIADLDGNGIFEIIV